MCWFSPVYNNLISRICSISCYHFSSKLQLLLLSGTSSTPVVCFLEDGQLELLMMAALDKKDSEQNGCMSEIIRRASNHDFRMAEKCFFVLSLSLACATLEKTLWNTDPKYLHFVFHGMESLNEAEPIMSIAHPQNNLAVSTPQAIPSKNGKCQRQLKLAWCCYCEVQILSTIDFSRVACMQNGSRTTWKIIIDLSIYFLAATCFGGVSKYRCRAMFVSGPAQNLNVLLPPTHPPNVHLALNNLGLYSGTMIYASSAGHWVNTSVNLAQGRMVLVLTGHYRGTGIHQCTITLWSQCCHTWGQHLSVTWDPIRLGLEWLSDSHFYQCPPTFPDIRHTFNSQLTK